MSAYTVIFYDVEWFYCIYGHGAEKFAEIVRNIYMDIMKTLNAAIKFRSRKLKGLLVEEV